MDKFRLANFGAQFGEGGGRDGWNPNLFLLPSVVATTHEGDAGDKCTQNCHCSRGCTDHHLQHSLVTCTH
jgi:hypothetical protein